jgi:hypothetical protein
MSVITFKGDHCDYSPLALKTLSKLLASGNYVW